MLFARVPQSLKPLSRVWRAGQVERSYLAMVEGIPEFESQSVEEPIARDPGGYWRFQVSERGKAARTDVRVLRRGDGVSLVECRLQTGRTHQVRVHLAHIGLPVAGDKLYGAVLPGFPRPLLHAALLEMPHPKSGQRFRVEAPLPEDMAAVQKERISPSLP
jgi:23S rRNA pseudouridine1911/1915/1917 synthase